MDKETRDEIARLTAAVAELRDREIASEIAALRAEIALLRAGQQPCRCRDTWTWVNPGITYYPYYPGVTISGNVS